MAVLRQARHHVKKKTAHATEQQRPDVLVRRQAWFDGQPDLDPEKLIFIDETGTSTKMARLLYLPPYNTDFNPIEMAFSTLKALLRKISPRTVPELWETIGKLLDAFSPEECINYFETAGYEPD